MFTKNVVDANKVVLKKVIQDDLCKIAQVHTDSFPESALTRLGAKIVQRYYLWQLIGPHKKVRAVGAFLDEECLGFSFSGVFDGSISGFIDHNKKFLVKEVLLHPWLLFNPLFRKRLYFGIQLLKRFTKKKHSTNHTVDKDKFQNYAILSIAVSPKFQKLGVGKMLMLDAENEAASCGFDFIRLTVNLHNKKAIEFYEKLKWQKALEDNTWKGAMIKKLE